MQDTWIDFLAGQGFDHRGRTIERIWDYGDRTLEGSHDYIQWLFPLREPSPYNAEAPLLDDARVAAVREQPALQVRMLTSLNVMLRFYGFELHRRGEDISVEIDEERFDERTSAWVTPANHNFLRITRILRCLREVRLEAEARAFHTALAIPVEWYPDVVSERTQTFWRLAAGVEDDEPSPG